MGDQSFNQFAPVMEELGISQDSLDASDLELGEEVVTDEVTNEEPSEEQDAEEGDETEEDDSSVEESAPDGKEAEESDEATAKDEAPVEPAKEIEALKTAFEAEKKAFAEERQRIETEFVTQHAEKLKAHDEFDSFLSNLAEKDPELFSLLQEEFVAHSKEFKNPAIEGLKRQQEETAKALNEIKQNFSDEATRMKYANELNQLKSTIGKEAESLGLKPDYKLVEEVWKNNPKLSLEEAFHAKYGKSYAQAAASKAKVQAVEKKVQSRPVVSTTGTVQRSNSKSGPAVPTDAFGAVHYFAKQLAGKK